MILHLALFLIVAVCAGIGVLVSVLLLGLCQRAPPSVRTHQTGYRKRNGRWVRSHTKHLR